MAKFVRVPLPGGGEALFESADTGGLEDLGGADPTREDAVAELEMVATAAGVVCDSLRERMKPDEITLEIAIGVSADVGWFFAKSSLDGSLKVKVKWMKEIRQQDLAQAELSARTQQAMPVTQAGVQNLAPIE